MDLDFLLAEKAESDRRNSGPSCSTSKSSFQNFGNDSEDEEFEDSMVKERAGFISQIADDISAKVFHLLFFIERLKKSGNCCVLKAVMPIPSISSSNTKKLPRMSGC